MISITMLVQEIFEAQCGTQKISRIQILLDKQLFDAQNTMRICV